MYCSLEDCPVTRFLQLTTTFLAAITYHQDHSPSKIKHFQNSQVSPPMMTIKILQCSTDYRRRHFICSY